MPVVRLIKKAILMPRKEVLLKRMKRIELADAKQYGPIYGGAIATRQGDREDKSHFFDGYTPPKHENN